MRSRVGRFARALLIASLLLWLTHPALAEEAAESSGAAGVKSAADTPRAFLGGEGIDRTAPVGDVILDIAILRPFRVAKIPLGFGIFLASLPMYLIAWDVPEAWAFLVDGPFEDAFLQPFGRI